MAVSTAAAALAGITAAAAYLDARFHIRHDLRAGSLNNAAAEAFDFIAQKQKDRKLLVYHVLQDHALSGRGSYLFLEFEGRSWTYRQFYDDVQRVGNWLTKDLGVQADEMVALDGQNSAEFLMLWYALEGVGARIAFLNCNLTGESLVHSVRLSGARIMLADRAIDHLVQPCEDDLNKVGVRVQHYDQSMIESLSDTMPLPAERTHHLQAQDLHALIYTSGTTGLPKGVFIGTGRHLNSARSVSSYLKLKPGDKMYTCLPLYHGAGNSLCITPTIYAASSVVLGRKFSHKTFWPEVSASGANRLQYVGELCRYLVNAPVHPLERKHRVQEAWGNGMRPDVWERFRQRFNIPIIHELYAATDGMGATFNRNAGDFGRAAIGVRGPIWHHRNNGAEVRARIDPDTEDLIRDANHFVVRAEVGEPGEVLHRVPEELKTAAFTGYYGNEKASEKRWLRGAFAPNDLWFRSGDVMRQDADGRVFFVDRLGDTFRWRSENVSTNEVSDVLGLFDQIAEANVYGVVVPNADGRCGCATIVLADSTAVEAFDLRRLAEHVLSRLPRYAVPIFLRIAPELKYTGTFKIQKGQAKREGIDLDLIEKTGDRVFWLPPGATAYKPFTRGDWASLKDGRVKL